MIQHPTDPVAIAEKSDEQLLAAYEQTTGQPDDEEASHLLAEIERRGLDV